MTKRRLLPMASALVGLLVGHAGHADGPDSVRFAWNAPAGCPSREDVVAEIDRVLGDNGRRTAAARATVTKLAEDRWSVQLTSDAGGAMEERSFEAASCASLASATALIVAWMADVDHPALPPPAPPLVPAPAPVLETPQAPARQSPPVRGFAAASIAFDLGTLPSLAVGAEAVVGVSIRHVRLALSGADWHAQNAQLRADGTGLHAFEVGGRGCLGGEVSRRIELGPCIGASAVYVASHGFGESVPYVGHTVWPLAAAALLSRWAVWGPLTLRADVGLVVPILRPRFTVVIASDEEEVLHRPFVVAGRGAVGIELQFP